MSLAPITLPWSTSTVSVSVIDTTLSLAGLETSNFLGPPIEGFETFANAQSYAFLVEHGDDKLVFDLGFPVNWREDFPPAVVEQGEAIVEAGGSIDVKQYVSEILTDNGIDLESVTAVIWSHSHFDHIGKPSLFPPSTDLIVGPDTFYFFGEGYPVNTTSPYKAEAFEARTVTELSFPDNATRIGGFQAHDYFGDGSFYLLHAPGHEVGHLNGLARVSSDPESYIFMGADSFHHGSQIRPTEALPLPDTVDFYKPPEGFPDRLSGETFYPVHPSIAYAENLPPYAENLTSPTHSPYTSVRDDASFSRNPPIARDVISKIQAFDADERVLVVAAHDNALGDVIDFFPESANEWQAKGWKEQSRWRWLADFAEALGIDDHQYNQKARRSHPRQMLRD